MHRPLAAVVLALLIALIFVVPQRARACAPAPPLDAVVTVKDESAVIVWDAATKTEHFLRRASFHAQAKDFGFLVPTPSKPELAEGSDTSFDRLSQIILPEVVRTHRRAIEPTAILFAIFARRATSAPTSAAAAPVRVLEEKRVAGYDAVVLEADDAGALAQWLAEHGYAQRPALAEWLAPYVKSRWKLTAFKVADPAPGAQDGAAQNLTTGAVLMSFHTERPFFPYREPRDQREPVPGPASRSLRVFFVGTSRVQAMIGDGATAFTGKTVWSGPLDAAKANLPLATPPGAWLTVFEDDASPRPGVDDLWFDPAPDQTQVKPPPRVETIVDGIPLPLDLLVLVVAAGALVWSRARRRAREKTAASGS